MSSKKITELQPLQDLLDSVQTRLLALETKVGMSTSQTPSSPSKSKTPPPPAAISSPAAAVSSPAVKAYDVFLEKSVSPLADACSALGDEGMKNMGQLVRTAWTSLETIIAIASKAKKPDDVPAEVQPLLGSTQEAVKQMQALRLDRNYNDHGKALMESNAALSWILVVPPPNTPSAFIKEAASSTEFWSNRIRKQYKGKSDAQIAFCDALKAMLTDLTSYVQEYHKTGLTWNSTKGAVSVAEATIVVEEDSIPPAPIPSQPPHSPRPFINKVSGGSGGMSNLVAELQSKRTADGSSAATGLKHVTKDQQTWRKEFKGGKKATASPSLSSSVETMKPKSGGSGAGAGAHTKLTGLPICEYQERGHKWIVEHQTKETTGGKVLTVDITDPKQQVYMFQCHHITLQIKGKCKSVILDSCQRCSVVFDTVISACEIVHCKKIQIQTTGVCPSFSIDQTEGCVLYLSKESVSMTNFVTCQSTEMNVSFPDADGEQKELPIPEQFVHKLSNGAVTSEVSDVYH